MNRDELAHCPRCGSGLDVTAQGLGCGQCDGELMPERLFLETVTGEQARSLLAPRQFWQFDANHPHDTGIEFLRDLGPAIESDEPALTCPCAAATMTKHAVYKTTIDRCTEHGVWLDGTHELMDIIKAATKISRF